METGKAHRPTKVIDIYTSKCWTNNCREGNMSKCYHDDEGQFRRSRDNDTEVNKETDRHTHDRLIDGRQGGIQIDRLVDR